MGGGGAESERKPPLSGRSGEARLRRFETQIGRNGKRMMRILRQFSGELKDGRMRCSPAKGVWLQQEESSQNSSLR